MATENMTAEQTEQKSAKTAKTENNQTAPKPGREAAWAELMKDHEAIKKHYKKEDKDIPYATQRRMSKQIADFNWQWDNKMPTKEQFVAGENIVGPVTAHFIAYKELNVGHKVIEQHWGGKEKMPASTVDRMKSDMRDYWKEKEIREHWQDRKREKEFGNDRS